MTRGLGQKEVAFGRKEEAAFSLGFYITEETILKIFKNSEKT